MKKTIYILSIILLLSGCSSPKTESPTPTTENKMETSNEKLKVSASFYPLAFIAEQVGGETIEVKNLTGSRDVHDYDPSPQDVVQINESDLFIFQGSGLETWGEDIAKELEKKNVPHLEVSKTLTLRKSEEGGHGPSEEKHHEHEHEHDDDHTHEEGTDHNHHDHGEFDPHTWLDPVLAQEMIDLISKKLAEVSPENKMIFAQNAIALKEKFQNLDQSYKTTLQNCQNEALVSHDAFGYLEDRYQITLHSVLGLSTADEPSAQQIAMLKEEAAEGMTHILIEDGNLNRFAEIFEREANLKTLPINPLGQGTLDENKDFFDIMDENLKSLKTALNCS